MLETVLKVAKGKARAGRANTLWSVTTAAELIWPEIALEAKEEKQSESA